MITTDQNAKPRYHVRRISFGDLYYEKIDQYRRRTPNKNLQLHHVVPKCLGRKRDVVVVKDAEHVFLHWLMNIGFIQAGRTDLVRTLSYPRGFDPNSQEYKWIVSRLRFLRRENGRTIYMTASEIFKESIASIQHATKPTYSQFVNRLIMKSVFKRPYFLHRWTIKVI